MSLQPPVSASGTPPPGTGPRTAGPPRAVRLAELIVRVRELGLVGILVIVLLATTVVNPRFLQPQSLRDMLLNVSIVALLAVGQALVVIMRHFDLSVGSILGFVAFLVGQVFLANKGLPLPLAFLIGTAVGVGFGLLNGLLVAVGRVPSLVVTLGMLYVIRGFDYAWASGKQVNAVDLPDAFLGIGTGTLAGIPYLAIVTLVVLLAVGYFLRNFRAGRECYAIGSSPEAAVLAGIDVRRRTIAAFAASGGLAGLAGVLYIARFGTVDATAGLNLELQVIAAVVVGGVAIFGGSGSVYGAALGAVVLSVIGSALVALKVPSFWQQAVQGMLLLSAISLDRLVAVRREALLRRRRSENDD